MYINKLSSQVWCSIPVILVLTRLSEARGSQVHNQVQSGLYNVTLSQNNQAFRMAIRKTFLNFFFFFLQTGSGW